MHRSGTIICIRTLSSSMSFLSGSLRFTDGWRNPARAWRHFCGLPDHHGEVFESYRYNRAGNGEHIPGASSLGPDFLSDTCWIINFWRYIALVVHLVIHFYTAMRFDLWPQMTKSVTCPEELGGLASQVTVDYSQLAQQGRLAAATAEPEEVRINPALWDYIPQTNDLR